MSSALCRTLTELSPPGTQKFLMAEEKVIWEKHTSENSDISGSRQLAENSLLSSENVFMENLTGLAEAVPRQ